jgi:NIMA (never in mitosis gene a)-related kinase
MEKYTFQKLLGRGAFGEANLVKRKSDGKPFVVKLTLGTDDKAARDARKEAALLKSLHHPNIVSYIEHFEEGGQVFIVTEYCDGTPGNLLKLINDSPGNKLSVELTVRMLLQLASALSYMHEKSIIHRDVKSANLFLMSDGTVKLGDFGIGRVIEEGFAETQVGTPAYTPPAIICNLPYDFHCDVWSLGVTVYQMLTGRLPFASLRDVLHTDPAPLPPNVPAWLDQLVRHDMLNKMDADRSTMEQVEAKVMMCNMPLVVWRDLKVRTSMCQNFREVQRRFAGRITLIASETNEEAFHVLDMSIEMKMNRDAVFVVTNRADGGEQFCREVKKKGISTQILCFCRHVDNFPDIAGVTVDTKKDAVERFIERYVLRT